MRMKYANKPYISLFYENKFFTNTKFLTKKL